jgi:general secretion pathway protein E
MSADLVRILCSRGKLSEDTVRRVRGLEEASGEPLHHILSRLGFVAESDLAAALSEAMGLDLVRAGDYPETPVLRDQLNVAFLRACRVLPLDAAGEDVVVAMADPLDRGTLRALELKLGRRIVPRVAVPAELGRGIDRLYGGGTEVRTTDEPAVVDAADLVRLREAATDEPVVRLVNDLIAEAVAARASDIHLEPQDGGVRLRLRVDGLLSDRAALPAAKQAAIASRIKIMAGLDIIERRRPQDGRCRVSVQGRPIDVRVSCVPTVHGESVALRILDHAAAPLDLGKLGLSPAIRRHLDQSLTQTNGIILATGPTGSGKTTTLYAALQSLNQAHRKLITIEDPVEYELAGIHQIQVRPQIGLGFAQLLRSILRHDPNIILVGEIRDRETAEIAVQAALTGHLVLTTLHTNDAPSALTRLADMGIEPFLITSTVRAVLAQRLVRTICPHCRAPDRDAETALEALRGGRANAWRGSGCDHCGGSGYVGRTAIAEFVPMADALRAAVLARADTAGLTAAAAQNGFRPMRGDGIDRVLAGDTTLAEVLRVT